MYYFILISPYLVTNFNFSRKVWFFTMFCFTNSFFSVIFNNLLTIHSFFRYRVCFEQGVPRHSSDYRVQIHCKTCCDMIRTHSQQFPDFVWKCRIQWLLSTDYKFIMLIINYWLWFYNVDREEKKKTQLLGSRSLNHKLKIMGNALGKKHLPSWKSN